MNSDVDLAHDITDATDDGDPKEVPKSAQLREIHPLAAGMTDIPQSNIGSCINFVWFLHVRELERVAGVLDQISVSRELFQLG